MRYIGAVFVIVSLFAAGVCKARECRMCCDTLQSAIAMLDLISSEICTMRSPINRLTKRMEACLEGEIKCFASKLSSELDRLGEERFCAIWRSALISCVSSLPEDCLEAVVSLGNSIGRYDSEMQKQSLDGCRAVLCAHLELIRPELKSRQKMYIGLFGGIGMIVAIVLI